jgi:D-amino-acid oxidase
VTFYFKQPIGQNQVQLAKMEELKHKVQGFKHHPALIAENQVNRGLGLRDAYTHLAPMIDTDVYMRWLLGEARRRGCRILEGKIKGPLREQEETLARKYGVDAIVNCAGLGAQELAQEPVYPVRGAIIRVRNDGSTMPRITQAHCVSHNGSSQERGFVFIVPRGDDQLVLGGIAEPDESDIDIGMHNHAPIREMYRRCVEFLPALKHAEIDAAEPVRVGLRPFRDQGVRLEHQAGTRIIHNYAHGGSGVTLSWGCAMEVAERADSLVAGNLQPRHCVKSPVS